MLKCIPENTTLKINICKSSFVLMTSLLVVKFKMGNGRALEEFLPRYAAKDKKYGIRRVYTMSDSLQGMEKNEVPR